MAIRTKTALASQITSLLADNTSGDISPADLRSVVTDIIDSLVFAVAEADIIPNADGTLDLGSNAARFAQGYVDELHVTNGIVITEAADHPVAPAAGLAQIWIANTATQTVQVTFDDGSDVELLHSGSGDDLTTTTAIVGADIVPSFDASASNAPIGRTWTNIIADLGIQVEPSEGGFADGDKTKLDYITVTQAVDLDQMETDIAALANGMVYAGNWDASAGSFPGGGTAQTGAFYTVSVGGTVDGTEFAVGDRIIAITDNASTTTYAANWTKVDATDAVQSVAGLVGTITDSGLRSALGLVIGTNVQAYSADLVTYAANPLTSGELGQLQNIDTTTISAAQWGYLGAMGAQPLEASAIGVTVQGFDADTLKADTSDVLTAGFGAAVDDNGTQSSGTYTPDYTTGNFKQIINGGAFALAPPSPANDNAISITLMIINNASAGAITTTGFDHVAGDSFDTTNTNRFLCQIDVYDDGGVEFATLQVLALQ